MRFAEPQLLYLLLLLPVLAGAAFVSASRRRRALRSFAGGAEFVSRFDREVSPHRRVAKVLLLLVATGATVVALARPQWGTRLEPVTRRGVDIVLVLDTSMSMAARDVPPDRLGQARYTAFSLVRRLGGDRVGLVTFAGRATLACPLTLDHGAVRLFLESADVEVVPVPGTALGEALLLAARAFDSASGSVAARDRVVVLLTDGEDHEGKLDSAIGALRRIGAQVFAIGCGTRAGGPIPLPGPSGGYKKDRSGKPVATHLDEGVLENLALETGGRYFRATPSGSEVDAILEAIAGLEAGESETVLKTRYEDRFQIPLSLAFVALVAETLLPDRRRRGEPLSWLRRRAVGGTR